MSVPTSLSTTVIEPQIAGSTLTRLNGAVTVVSIDDPIAEKLLSESPYERLRARQFSYFRQPIDRKLAWQSYLLFALAALLPVLSLVPPSIRRAYLGDVATASPKIAFIALVAVIFVAGTGVGHALVGHFCLRRRPLDERQARELVTFETVFSMLGFGTGGLATLTTYALVSLAFGGEELLTRLLAAGGGNPFAPNDLGVTVGMVAVVALVAGVALQTVSAHLHVAAVLTDAQ
jgi:choline-glycine betaine transporter